uniref:Uncharacterized protein n=1 Tax=Amphimedon queenslandica TaxID=400682 RepID=A0A1X7UTN7_AMPQE
DMNWGTLVGVSIFSKQLCDVVFDKDLSQLVQSPTHIKGGILDVLTNCKSIVSIMTVASHSPVGCDDFAVILRLCGAPYKFLKHFRL